MKPNFLKISPSEIKPGDTFYGYELPMDENGNTPIKICHTIINEQGKPEDRFKQEIADEIVFYFKKMERNFSHSNECDLTNPRTQLNLIGLHTDLYSVGDSYHDGWNSWIIFDWKKQLSNIAQQNFYIVGVVETSPWPGAFIENSMALVIEYDATGNRVWYHVDPNKITKMRAESLEAYNALMAK